MIRPQTLNSRPAPPRFGIHMGPEKDALYVFRWALDDFWRWRAFWAPWACTYIDTGTYMVVAK